MEIGRVIPDKGLPLLAGSGMIVYRESTGIHVLHAGCMGLAKEPFIAVSPLIMQMRRQRKEPGSLPMQLIVGVGKAMKV